MNLAKETKSVDMARFACTTIIVGKDATEDGSVIVAHSDDDVGDERAIFVPARDWDLSIESEKNRLVYYDNAALGPLDGYNSTEIRRYIGNARGPRYRTQSEGYAESKPLGFIPQVSHTYAYFDSNYGIMNEHGLMIGECTCGAKHMPNPMPGRRIFYAAELSRVALERCKRAREAILLIGSLIAEYGYYGTGETLLLGDADEGWVMEMAAYEDDGMEGVWVAQRVPDDHFFAAANEFRIRDIKRGEEKKTHGVSGLDKNVWYSPNLFFVAEAQGWIVRGNTIDWLPCISWGEYLHPYYSLRRVWRALSKANPEHHLPARVESGYTRAYPFSLNPSKKLSILDVASIYRDHYEGTAFDLTQGPVSEPWSNPVRYENNPDKGNTWNLNEYHPHGAWERPISIYRSGMMWINQAKRMGGGDSEVIGFSWIGLDRPVANCLMPFYSGIEDLPPALQTMNLLEFEFEGDSAWWAFNFVANHANLNYRYMMKEVRQYQSKLENDAYNRVASCLNSGELNGIDEFCSANFQKVVAQWWNLAKYLIVKYNDGCITTAPNAIMNKIDYPEEWLKQVGYYDGPTRY